MKEYEASGRRKVIVASQLIDDKANKVQVRRKPASSATCLNNGVRDSVIRILFDSELEITQFRKAAYYAGAPESKALDVVRDYVYSLRAAAKAGRVAC